MATNGMTINGLNPLSALTADDKIPVWDTGASGEPTKEITAQKLANSVKSLANLPNTTEMNTAIAQSMAVVVPDDSLFSNKHANVSELRARRAGNVMLISVTLETGVPDNAVLFTIDSTIQPPAANIIAPLYKQNNGELVTYGSVWVEGRSNRIVRYYGTQATQSLTCCSFTYIIS